MTKLTRSPHQKKTVVPSSRTLPIFPPSTYTLSRTTLYRRPSQATTVAMSSARGSFKRKSLLARRDRLNKQFEKAREELEQTAQNDSGEGPSTEQAPQPERLPDNDNDDQHDELPDYEYYEAQDHQSDVEMGDNFPNTGDDIDDDIDGYIDDDTDEEGKSCSAEFCGHQ
jgi:hypothetical protein